MPPNFVAGSLLAAINSKTRRELILSLTAACAVVNSTCLGYRYQTIPSTAYLCAYLCLTENYADARMISAKDSGLTECATTHISPKQKEPTEEIPMSTRKSNTARLKSQTSQPKLTEAELQRIAQKLASTLAHDPEKIGLLLMLFDQLELSRGIYINFYGIVSTIKQHLFIGTDASLNAQNEFQADAYRERGKLLLWPNERKGAK